MNESIWHGRRVLLTGHTGFKGSWLALWLLEMGAELYGLSLPFESQISQAKSLFGTLQLAERMGSHNWSGDIRDPETLAEAVSISQPEVVFHLAGQAFVRRSYEDPIGTWSTNVQGSLNLLNSLQKLSHPCAVVMVTTDKVYQNQEWLFGYRETDRLGGRDPYSASKAAMELAVDCWRSSFCGTASHQSSHLLIATARAGNVIAGGDWGNDRIFPDAIRALVDGKPIPIRNPSATRPWQHVLEPLSGYLLLAQKLYDHKVADFSQPNPYSRAFNFGPSIEANQSVQKLIEVLLSHWTGSWVNDFDLAAPHEAVLLHLTSDLAHQQLGWRPCWDFTTAVERTARWYYQVHHGVSALECCLSDLLAFRSASNGI